MLSPLSIPHSFKTRSTFCACLAQLRPSLILLAGPFTIRDSRARDQSISCCKSCRSRNCLEENPLGTCLRPILGLLISRSSTDSQKCQHLFLEKRTKQQSLTKSFPQHQGTALYIIQKVHETTTNFNASTFGSIVPSPSFRVCCPKM